MPLVLTMRRHHREDIVKERKTAVESSLNRYRRDEVRMLAGRGVLLGFQAAGEAAARLLHLAIPGSIIGLALLLGWLCIRGASTTGLEQTVEHLHTNMGLLFVPAGAGIVLYADASTENLVAVAIAVIFGTMAAIAATAFVARETLSGDKRLLLYLDRYRSRGYSLVKTLFLIARAFIYD